MISMCFDASLPFLLRRASDRRAGRGDDRAVPIPPHPATKPFSRRQLARGHEGPGSVGKAIGIAGRTPGLLEGGRSPGAAHVRPSFNIPAPAALSIPPTKMDRAVA